MANPFNSSDRPANNQNEHPPRSYEQERLLASQKCYETVGGQFIANHPKLDNFMREHQPFTNIYNILGVECSEPKTDMHLLVPVDKAMVDAYE